MTTSFIFDRSEFENCLGGDDKLSGMPLAMAYVPIQKWEDIYDADVGLERGTLFAKLDLPFLGKRANER